MARPEETGFPYVTTIIRASEVDSTNDLGRRLIDRGELPVRTLIWADRQTRGRGQGSNAWWSDEGSLTATIAIDPTAHGLTVAHGPRVALAVASGIASAIRALYPSCRAGIRWPNDIEAEGRKLGGLLVERVETPGAPRLLVGIGINVRTRLDAAPAEVRRMAASLAGWDEVRPAGDPKARLLEGILGRIEYPLGALARGRRDLVDRWNELDTLAGKAVRVAVGPEIIEAVAEGIDDLGGLKLRSDGRPRVIYAGRVLRD